jgi:hypothetical protein
VTIYGLLIGGAVAILFSLRYGRDWNRKWRAWMYGNDAPAKRNRHLT